MRTAFFLFAFVTVASASSWLDLVKILYNVKRNQAMRMHQEAAAENSASPEPFSYFPFPEGPTNKPEPESSSEPGSTPEPENPWPMLVKWARAESEPRADTESEPEADPEAAYKHLAWFFLAVVFMGVAVALSIALAVTCTKLKAQTKM